MFHFGLKDIIDIFLMAVFLYYCYRVMKQTRSVNLFFGILFFFAAWILVSKVLEMKLLGSILDQLINVGAIALIILFQDDIRRFFYSLGSHNKVERFFRKLLSRKKEDLTVRYTKEQVEPIVAACMEMSRHKVGALIVFENDLSLDDYAATGEITDARISQRLIMNIFYKGSPLHDCAIIIKDGKLAAAACVLPISNDMDMPKKYGMRHRAAKGMSKETDALAIVVSEENGIITAAYNDTLMSHVTEKRLTEIIMEGRF